MKCQPPSTARLMPLTDRFVSRNRAASRMSAIVGSRPVGVFDRCPSSTGAGDPRGFGKIEADAAGSTAELTGDARRALRVATRDDDLGALLREMAGDRFS